MGRSVEQIAEQGEREVQGPVSPIQGKIVFNGTQDIPNQEDHQIRPAHTPGHFPTVEEVTRLVKLERRRAKMRETSKRWREQHPEQNRQSRQERTRRWRKSHPKEYAAHMREYMQQYRAKKKSQTGKTIESTSQPIEERP